MPETIVMTPLRMELDRLRAVGLSRRDYERLLAAPPTAERLEQEGGRLSRQVFDAVADTIDVEARTVRVAFSDESEVDRWWGILVLDHSPGACRLERLNNGAPVLLNHDTYDPLNHVGTIVEATIDADRVGRAKHRFGRSERAEMAFRDVQDGIRTKISVGFIIHKLQLVEESDDAPSRYRVVDWEPYENSYVPVPAIDSVGVGLSAALSPLVHAATAKAVSPVSETVAQKENDMPEQMEVTPAAAASTSAAVDTVAVKLAVEAETQRVRRIYALGTKYEQPELAEKFILEGKPFADFAEALGDVLGSRRPVAQPVAAGDVGLTPKEQQRFSIIKLARYLVEQDHATLNAAGFEIEACKAASKVYGKESGAGRYTLPREVFQVPRSVAVERLLATITDDEERRDRAQRYAVSSQTGATGGYWVGKEMGSFIDLLRELTVLGEVGATYIGDLVGDISFGRLTSGSSFYWVGDEEDLTESGIGAGELELHPRSVGGRAKITRKMLKQSSYDVEMIVRGDIFAGLANGIQQDVFNGPGGLKRLQGVLKTSGIGDVAGGTNGAAPTYAHMVQLEGKVAIAKALSGRLAYVTNNKVRSQLRQTAESASMAAAGWVWRNTPGGAGVGDIGGYPAYATGDVPSTLVKNSSGAVCSAIIFGAWQHLLIGMWGGIDIELDRASYVKQGALVVQGLQDIDCGLRHVGAFAAMQDALTASA